MLLASLALASQVEQVEGVLWVGVGGGVSADHEVDRGEESGLGVVEADSHEEEARVDVGGAFFAAEPSVGQDAPARWGWRRAGCRARRR